MKYALLIIDMQYRFFRTEERRRNLDKLVQNINELTHWFECENLPVIHVLTVHQRDKSTWDLGMRRKNQAVLIEGTKEARELCEIVQSQAHQRLVKTRHSAFIRTDLEGRLRNQGIEALVICGVMTHACVGLTAIDAYERDFSIIVAKECIFSHRKLKAEVMLHMLEEIFHQEILSNAEIHDRLG